MVFVSELLIISCLLAFQTAEGTVTLTSSHQTVNALTTNNFILNCTYEGKKGQVVSMELSKVTQNEAGDDALEKLATMNPDSSIDILNPSQDITYTGNIEGKEKAYLAGKWNKLPVGFGGIYNCAALVLEDEDHGEIFYSAKEVEEEKARTKRSAFKMALLIKKLMALKKSKIPLHLYLKALKF